MDFDDGFTGEIDLEAMERYAMLELQARKAAATRKETAVSGAASARPPSPAIAQLHCARRKSVSPFKGSCKRQAVHDDWPDDVSEEGQQNVVSPPSWKPKTVSAHQVQPGQRSRIHSQASQTSEPSWHDRNSSQHGANSAQTVRSLPTHVDMTHHSWQQVPMQSTHSLPQPVPQYEQLGSQEHRSWHVPMRASSAQSGGQASQSGGTYPSQNSLSHAPPQGHSLSNQGGSQDQGMAFQQEPRGFPNQPSLPQGKPPRQPPPGQHPGAAAAGSARPALSLQVPSDQGHHGRSCIAPNLQNLWARIDQYRKMANTLPPPPASHKRCPGVFKHSLRQCGAQLGLQVKHFEVQNSSECQTLLFYRCSDPECDFLELLPERKMLPNLSCEALDASKFKVSAAIGAEEAVRHCGGLDWILKAVSCPVRPLASHGVDGVTEPSVVFDLAKYEDVIAPLRNQKRLRMRLLCAGGEISESTRALFRKPSAVGNEAETEELFKKIPAPLERALMPFQREGVMYGLRHGGRVLIADEMGVGKTVQAIALAAAYQAEWPLLVVAPASLRLVWAEELERWLPHMRPNSVHVITGKVNRLGPDFHPPVVITSYEMMGRLTCNCCGKGGPKVPGAAGQCAGPEECMAARGFKVVIVDESHVMRTTHHPPDARHTESVAAACKRAKRAILLTGTPSLSRPFDLFRQVDALRPGLVGRTREAFSVRYCNRRLIPVGKAEERRQKYSNNGLSHAHELHVLLKKEIMLRRLKQDVMSQLPPKRRQVIRLPAPQASDWPKQPSGEKGDNSCGGSADEEEVEDDQAEEDDEEAGEKEQSRYGPAWSSEHRTAVAKLPNVIEWLAHALASPTPTRDGDGEVGTQPPPSQTCATKMLLFAHHIDVMDKLASALSGQHPGFPGAVYVRIDGSTDGEDRRAAVNRFRDDPLVSVALLSVTAAGVGLDFSSASTVVFAELPAEVAHVRQAEDRAHRKGQHRPVNVYFLVAKSTSDERRWQNLNSSLERVTAVHDGQNPNGNAAKDSGRPAGILLDALHDVTATQGWIGRMTQLPPQLSHQPLGKQSKDEEPVDLISDSESEHNSQSAQDVGIGKPGGRENEPGGQPAGGENEPGGTRLSPPEAQKPAACNDQSPAEVGEEPESVPGTPLCSKTQPTTPVPVTTPDSLGKLGALLDDLKDRLDKRRKHSTPPSTSPKPQQQDIAAASDKQVYFEVSGHTGRVHFHLASDGSWPLGLSLPQELLTMPGTPATIDNLLKALDTREDGSSHVGPAGVLAIPMEYGRTEVERMIEEARVFTAEWIELRAIMRKRLLGHCLQPPLKDVAEDVLAGAAEAGAFGSSTDRYLTTARTDLNLPDGAEWLAVKVKYVGRARLMEYKQPFVGEQRLCCLCAAPVSWCDLPRTAVLGGASALFCCPACENKYCMRTNNALIRRELFKLERGRCQLCKLDCHALVKALRAIEKGGDRWEFLRKQKLILMAPQWGARGATNAANKLCKQVLEGNAWQADHIIPVYKGGGLCDLDNFRTLCTICHQEVTKAQAKDRAEQRKLRNQPKLQEVLAGSKSKPGRKKKTARFTELVN